MQKSLRGPALNEAIRTYVKQYIVDNKLDGGDPLPPETRLAQQLGVGRSSVREAIKALESLGIVEVRHGNGLYVREYNFDPVLEVLSYSMRFDPVRLAELFQVRIWLESAVIGDAIKQIGPEELASLDQVMAEWERRVEAGAPHADLDEQFHCILYGALDNQTLLKFFEVFWIAFENLDIESIQSSDPLEELAHHQALLEAVRLKDPSLARQRLIQHFSHLQARIHQYIDQRDSAGLVS